MCRCAYPQEILIQFFLLELRPFNLTKLKDTTDSETVYQHNSSEFLETL